MKKFIEDNFIVILILGAIVWGLINFMSTPADRSGDNDGCTEYETTSKGTFCTDGQ